MILPLTHMAYVIYRDGRRLRRVKPKVPEAPSTAMQRRQD